MRAESVRGSRISAEERALRRRVKDRLEVCYYCGQLATSVDHVVPWVMLKQLEALGDEAVSRKLIGRKKSLVPACGECNSLLGADYYGTLTARKKALKAKLLKRYSRMLASPRWYEEEMNELGPNLRRFVRMCQDFRDTVILRLRY